MLDDLDCGERIGNHHYHDSSATVVVISVREKEALCFAGILAPPYAVGSFTVL